MSLFNNDLEKSVLATLMSHEDVIAEKGIMLSAGDFYSARHQTIFSTIDCLHKNNMGYDAVMVMDHLNSRHELDRAGGEEYLGDILANSSATLFNLTSYVERIKDLSIRRQVKKIFDESNGQIEDANKEVIEAVNDVVSQLNNISVQDSEDEIVFTKDLCDSTLLEIHQKASGAVEPYISTGFTELDQKIAIQKSDLVIVAGRPSMGKSTFVQNIMMYIAKTNEGSTVFFSLEMPKNLVMNRLISAVGSVNLNTIMTGGRDNPDGQPTEEEWGGISDGLQFLQDLPLVIDDKTKSIAGIRAKLNKIKHETKQPIALVVVDYIGLMKEIVSSENRVNATTQVSNNLKDIARDYDCVVIALSQLNRSLETRPNKRPIMSDLRESGAIEQDADKILFVYRDEVYNKDTEDKGIGEIIIGKQRNGPLGTVRMGFEGQYSRFTELLPSFDDEPTFGGNHA